jgi:hypothetical protein
MMTTMRRWRNPPVVIRLAMQLLEARPDSLDEPAHILDRHGAEAPRPFQPVPSDGVEATSVKGDLAVSASGKGLAGLRLVVVAPTQQLLDGFHVPRGHEKEKFDACSRWADFGIGREALDDLVG